jgi:glucose-6-phosphate isomerase
VRCEIFFAHYLSSNVHSGKIGGQGGKFKNFLFVGISATASESQFVAHTLGDPRHRRTQSYFFDNGDTHRMNRVFASIKYELGQTMCAIISKSGDTTRHATKYLSSKLV